MVASVSLPPSLYLTYTHTLDLLVAKRYRTGRVYFLQIYAPGCYDEASEDAGPSFD